MPPLQAGEPRKSAIKRQPFATKLDRQRGMERVRHKIASRIASPAEIDENFPVTRARPEKMHLFTRSKVFQKIERPRERRRILKNFRMRDHGQATAQGTFR